ncbi:MAG TPA: hypothetical protein VGJ95_15155 [Pseudonocardiaceae bacterium]|jgi:hypothetical protein
MRDDDREVEEERQRDERLRLQRARAFGVLTTVVRTIGGAAALILVAYIVLTLGGANPDNGITKFVASWADTLAFGFRDLFTPADDALRVVVNYGLAALFWLIITGVVTRLLRRLSSPYLIS